MLKWVVILFPRGFSWPRIKLGSPALQANSLLSDPPGTPKQVCLAMKHVVEAWDKPQNNESWHEIHILPSELSNLILSRTHFSACTKDKNLRKRWHYTKTWDDLWFCGIWCCLFAHVHVLYQTQLYHAGTGKLPCPRWRKNWGGKPDVYSRMRKNVAFFSLSTFPLIAKL